MRNGNGSALTMLVAAIVAGALFWLLRDHWNHALGALPYLLFLTCPVMHLFMHHGHGHDAKTQSPQEPAAERIHGAQ